MNARCWEAATLLPVQQAELSAGWVPVDADKDPVYTDDRGRTSQMLRGAVKCDEVGETITVRWNGTTLGFSDIPHGDPMTVEVVIDGATTHSFERVQQEARHQSARFFYLPELEPGKHTVTLTIKKLPEGVSFYAGQLLVAGTPLP